MTPLDQEVMKLVAKFAAERATVLSCVSLIRTALPVAPTEREATIQTLQRFLEEAQEQTLPTPVQGLEALEQHLASDLYREALVEAHNHLLAELRK